MYDMGRLIDTNLFLFRSFPLPLFLFSSFSIFLFLSFVEEREKLKGMNTDTIGFE